MIKLFGSPHSSAHRCYWVLEELNIPYERQPLDMRQREHKAEAYLKLNPNGKIPCIIDGNFVLWESVAINHYLALKNGPQLLGKTIEEQALVQQWILWSQGELQLPLVSILIQVMFMPEDKKNPSIVEDAKKKLQPLNAILNTQLQDKNYVVGDTFTLADLTLASVVRINEMTNISLADYPNIQKWYQAVTKRTAYQKVEALPR